ncbi:hypothetical protein BJ878DRAFT_490512 [Calycina marina]|uniref:RRM domain-containing protein n=1 Tax=Calycina marina TaxID=1763456 RepID=A0A9P8CI39_9HELO|nr:hypothetical protein BJ878DRAFT_490512 [Calycina marina]
MSTFSSKPPSRSVFIGNIPYGLTEEQIIELFSSAGKVLGFRLVIDRETGKPKGFGFAEYPDIDSASSAVRNLNDHEVMGRRLKVDFSNDNDDNSNNHHNNNDTAHQQQYNNYPPPTSNGYNQGHPPPMMQNGSSLPPLPIGIDVPPNLTCPDAISRTLHSLSPTQLLDVISQMKTLTSTDPAKATELLQQAPQLAYAIFQALLLMGLVSTEALGSVVEHGQAGQAPMPIDPYGQQAGGSYPPGFPPPPQHMSGQLGMQMDTPPVQNQHLYPPPPQRAVPPLQQQPPPQQAPAPALDGDLLQQVLAMSQELVDSLPTNERAQLMGIRAQYAR